MSDERQHHLESIDQPSVHHEETDINIRAVFGFGGGLLVTTIVVMLAMWGLFRYLDGRAERLGGSLRPLATNEVRLPPEPRLQITPRADAAEFRAQEDALLNGYSWVNRETGTVRIPIAEAMKMTLQRGLPAREQPAGQQK